jgi:hypothetical protein
MEQELKKEEKGSVVIEEETRISRIRRMILPSTSKDVMKDININLLRGKTLQIYWYLYEKGPAGVREIQRALNYASPGNISYQVKKLSENGLIIKDKTTDKYSVSINVKAGLLNFYIKLGPLLIPRFSLYLIVCFTGYLIFLLGAIFLGDPFITHPVSLLFLCFLSFGSIAFIYESRIMWKLKPY